MTGMWLLTAFFVISNFLGELTSTSVTDEPIQAYINSMEDMKQRNISWIDYYDIEKVLIEGLPEQRKYKKKMHPREALGYVLDHPTEYVFYSPIEAVDALIRLYFWNGKGENPFYFSPPLDGEIPLFITGYLRRGSPYAKTLTRKVLDIEAAGLLRGKFMPKTTDIIAQASEVDDHHTEKEEKKVSVSLQNLSLYLYTCCGMLSWSLVVFLMELCAPTVIMLVEGLNELRRQIFWG